MKDTTVHTNAGFGSEIYLYVGLILLGVALYVAYRYLPIFIKQLLKEEITKSKDSVLALLKHAFVTGGVLLVLFFSLWLLADYGEGIADRKIEYLLADDSLDIVNVQKTVVARYSSKADLLMAKRFRSQLNSVVIMSRFHLSMTRYFLLQYFYCITIASIFGIIAAIALVLFIRRGFDNANPYVVNLFFTSVAVSTLFYSFPFVYKQEDNLNKNVTLYKEYTNLRKEMFSYAAIQNCSNGDLKKLGRLNYPLCRYIAYVDSSTSIKFNIPLGFDMTKVNDYKKFFDEFQKSTTQ
jgi:hypothetical protein